MTVDTASARFTAEYEGKAFYFCAPGCKKAFEKDPASYVQRAKYESTLPIQQEESGCSCCQPQRA